MPCACACCVFFIGGVEPRCWLFFPSPGFCYIRYIRYTEVGQAPGLFRTPKAYPQPPLVHECALAYFRGNLTDYAHAWTGMNYLPQAPQSSALPSCATARRPISTGQENVTGQPPGVPSGISLQRHPHTVASPTDSRSAWGRRLAIATRRLRSRLRSRCGGGVPISNTGDESDNPND